MFLLIKTDDRALLSEVLETHYLKLAATSERSAAADALLLSAKMSLPVCDDKGVFIGRFTCGFNAPCRLYGWDFSNSNLNPHCQGQSTRIDYQGSPKSPAF